MSSSLVPIVIKNFDTNITQTEISKVAKALRRQVNEQFALPPPFGYGLRVKIRVATPSKPPMPNEWVMGLFKDPDIAGALGYHDETPSGQPLMKIFPALSSDPWSITASHELLETLADPNICRCSQDPYTGRIYAYEICDGVEADSYDIDGVRVSNFALPTYFEPPASLTGIKFDFMGLCTKPFETRKGGYNQWWDGRSWHSIENFQRESRKALHGKGQGRGTRRRNKVQNKTK